jgi:hypothetical protein
VTHRVPARRGRAGTRRFPRLSLAALLLASLAGAPARAQAPPPGVEQGVFELRVARIAAETVTGLLTSNGTVLVPLERVLALTGVPVQRTDSSITVERARSGGVATLQLHARRLVDRTGDLALGAEELLLVDGVHYLACSRVATWLGATVQADLAQLAVTITRTPPFPVEQAAARAQRTAAGTARGPTASGDVSATFEPRTGGAVVDWTASTTTSARALGGTAGTLRGAAALAGGDLVAGVSAGGDGVGGIRATSSEWSYRRGFPGSRIVRQIQVGDVLGGGAQLRSLHGVTVTNGRLVSDPFFGTVPVNVSLPQGWQYEVYQDGQLIGFSDPGIRAPVQVPLRYGATPVQVRLVSPTGDESVREYSYLIPQTQQQPGRLEYTAGAGRCTSGCVSTLFGDASYGVAPWLSVSAGAERQVTDDGARTLPQAAVSLVSFSGWNAQLQAARASFARASVTYGGGGPLVGSGSYQRTYSSAGQPSVLDDLRPTRWLFDGQLQLRADGGQPVEGWRVDNTLEGIDAGRAERSRTVVTADVRRGSIALSYEADRSRDLRELGIGVLSVLAPNARASSLLGTVLFGGKGIHALELSTAMQAGRRGSAGVTARWQRGTGLLASVGFNGSLGAMRLASRLNAAAGRPTSLATSASGSVALDGLRHPVPFEGPGVGLAGVAGRVFHDMDADGIFGPGDLPAAAVRVVVNGTPVRADSSGRYRAWTVIPYERAEIALDTLAFVDPSWTVQRGHTALRATPGVFNRVDFPLVRTRELAGTLVADSAVATAGGVTLLLTSVRDAVVQRIVTFADGSFYVSRVRPDRYHLTVAPSSLEALGASADPASQTVDVTASSEDPVLTVPVLRLRRRVDASAAPGGTKQPDP